MPKFKFAIVLPEDEVDSMLEALLDNVGFHDPVSLLPTDLDSKPFSIGGANLTEKTAQAFISLYGNKRRDSVFFPSGKSENVELLLSEQTVISVFSTAMHMQTLPIVHAEFCSGGLLLTFASDEVSVATNTIYAGFVMDRKRGEEGVLYRTNAEMFHPPESALFTHKLTREKAERANANGLDYDIDTIVVRKRIVLKLSALSPWEDMDAEEMKTLALNPWEDMDAKEMKRLF